MTDMISGRPTACEPAIRTLAKRQDRKRNRARFVVVEPAGVEPYVPDCHLFRAGHQMRSHLHDAPRVVDLYRTRSLDMDELEAYAWPPEVLPVGDEEIQWLLDATDPRLRLIADLYEPGSTAIRDVVRSERGDLSTLRWLIDSPYTLTEDDAFSRGDEHLTTEHLYCGVREVHHRWEYYRGLGGRLVVEGVADTREEARVMAQAHLWRAWVTRVEEVRERRLGDLSWGTPIGSPHTEPGEVNDPQASYTTPPEGGRN